MTLGGASAMLDAVDVDEQLETEAFAPGAGLWVTGCSKVTASGVRVRGNYGPGLIVDDSDAALSGGIEVRGNRIGVTVQTVGARLVEIDGAEISDNDGIGLFVASDASRVKLTHSAIASTELVSLPYLEGGVSAGSYESGDGMLWCHGARVELDGVDFSSNARVSLLIEGPVAPGSTLAHVGLGGGDETKGPIQQDLPEGGTQPELGPGAGPLEVTADQKLVAGCRP
jgi:hypothetical protein